MFQKALAGLERTRSFVRTGVWRIPSRHLPRRKSLLIRQLRIFLLTLRRFHDDRCQLRASALTFYTLLSIVPVLAMAFGVAKGFGFEAMLERQLLEAFADQQETALKVIVFSRTLLEKTQGGIIAGIGVVVLFWSVIKVLRHIEKSFNDIWGVKEGRPLQRQVSDYLSIMLVAPVLLVLAGSATVIVASRMESFLRGFSSGRRSSPCCRRYSRRSLTAWYGFCSPFFTSSCLTLGSACAPASWAGWSQAPFSRSSSGSTSSSSSACLPMERFTGASPRSPFS